MNKLFIILGVYFEVRAGMGQECNTRVLREHYGWTGLLFDPSFKDSTINLHKVEGLTHSNVLDLLANYQIGNKIDLIAIETDYAGECLFLKFEILLVFILFYFIFRFLDC